MNDDVSPFGTADTVGDDWLAVATIEGVLGRPKVRRTVVHLRLAPGSNVIATASGIGIPRLRSWVATAARTCSGLGTRRAGAPAARAVRNPGGTGCPVV